MNFPLPIQNEPYEGYNYLITKRMEQVANYIVDLLDCDADELETDKPLDKETVIDFISFCKLDYFHVQPLLAVTYDGYLGADWRLKNKTLINIVFHGGEIVTLGVTSKKHRFTKNLKLSSLVPQLKKINIPA